MPTPLPAMRETPCLVLGKELKQDVAIIAVLLLLSFSVSEASEPRADCQIVPITDASTYDGLWVLTPVSSGSELLFCG